MMACAGVTIMVMNMYRAANREKLQFDFIAHDLGNDDFTREGQALLEGYDGQATEGRSKAASAAAFYNVVVAHTLSLALDDSLPVRAHQRQVDLRHLHPALRHGPDKPFRLQPGHELADGAEREAGHLHKLALGDELPGPDLARQQAARISGIGLIAQVLVLARSWHAELRHAAMIRS